MIVDAPCGQSIVQAKSTSALATSECKKLPLSSIKRPRQHWRNRSVINIAELLQRLLESTNLPDDIKQIIFQSILQKWPEDAKLLRGDILASLPEDQSNLIKEDQHSMALIDAITQGVLIFMLRVEIGRVIIGMRMQSSETEEKSD